MQGQQPVIRQGDQQILQQPASIVIKMTEGIQQITPVGKFRQEISIQTKGVICIVATIKWRNLMKKVYKKVVNTLVDPAIFSIKCIHSSDIVYFNAEI